MSLSELLVILIVALIVLKPKQLPYIAKTLGQYAGYLQRLMKALKKEMFGSNSHSDQ